MADELEDLCKRISLIKGEKDGIQVDELDVSEARVIAGKCLIRKIWTDKNINQEAFKSVFFKYLAHCWVGEIQRT